MEILICKNHLYDKTPLLGTYAFIWYEHMCPKCWKCYPFLWGKSIKSSRSLIKKLDKYRNNKDIQQYLRSNWSLVCAYKIIKWKKIYRKDFSEKYKVYHRNKIKKLKKILWYKYGPKT